MKFNALFKFFPPPKFLDIPFAGLSISDSAVRCIQLRKKENKLYVEKYAEKSISPGTVAAGQINNKEEVVKILSDLKKNLNLEYVKISLPEEKAYLFTAKIPKVEKEEVRSAIESKIEENVPVSPSELWFDYNLFDYREEDHLNVVVSALPIGLIDLYVSLAKESGLSLLSLEIESQAIARALFPRGASDTSLIIHFGPEKVGLYVSSFRVIHFTSTIAMKGENLNNPSFLLQEIKKLYLYWHTLKENAGKPERKISRIIVCGEKFDDSMISYLENHLDTPIALANVWTNVLDINNTVPEIPFRDSLRYAASVGLALPSDVLV